MLETMGKPVRRYGILVETPAIVSSDKTMCDLHNFRIELARFCRRENIADTFGTFDGGKPVPH